MYYFNVIQTYNEESISFIEPTKIKVIFHSSRFTEYSDEDIRAAFKILDNTKIQNLKKFPCVICFENFKDFVALGKINEISFNEIKQVIIAEVNLLTEKIYLNDINNNITFIDLFNALDFNDLEDNRTHWAIKKGDIFYNLHQIYFSSDILDKSNNFPEIESDLLTFKPINKTNQPINQSKHPKIFKIKLQITY